jgi:hypothetical protein
MTLPSGTFLYLVGDIPGTADDPRPCCATHMRTQSNGSACCLRTKFSTA